MERDRQLLGDGTGVLVILGGSAVGVILVVPVAHEEGLHVPPLLLEQKRGHGRVDTARKANDDAGMGAGGHVVIVPAVPC
jgi:hypothetical protein